MINYAIMMIYYYLLRYFLIVNFRIFIDIDSNQDQTLYYSVTIIKFHF